MIGSHPTAGFPHRAAKPRSGHDEATSLRRYYSLHLWPCTDRHWGVLQRSPPPLLPEDMRYIGASLNELQRAAPGLPKWLQKVFWVMGGYIFTTGLLTVYVAHAMLRRRRQGSLMTLTFAGLTSITWMVLVNFLLHSDFKWLLLSVAVLWGAGLMLARREAHVLDATASQATADGSY